MGDTMTRRKAKDTILIVNDAPDQLDLMVNLLGTTDYEILTASDGHEGFEIAQTAQLDLIISDVLMPRMNGIELCRLIRECPELCAIPVLLVGAIRKDSESVIEGLKAGANEYMEVPCDPVHLVIKIVRLIERKRVEQELRESEERYRDIVENARDIIYTHDLKGYYTSVNKAGEQITGYTREEALGMNLTQTVAPEHHEKARQMIISKLAGEKETVYDLDIIAKNGRRIAVEVNTRLINRDGVPVGIQGIARDVTRRKQLEEQLRQAQKMEAIGRLAGGIAHDFNNMLTAITGYSELVIMQLQAQDPLREYIEEIKKAGDRAASLTSQLLAFSRKQVLQPKVLDLNAIVTEMEKMLRRLIGEDIELRIRLKPELGSIKADPGQIEQVALNLAVNARDAMPKGGKLTIETANVYLDEKYAARHIAVKPGPYVMLAVSDTGTGIDDEAQRHMFEPFFTTKDVGKGTGLGLSTVYGIVKQSGGNIWVYSEIGLGTTFKIYLPLAGEGAQVYKPCTDVEEAMQGSETILLAEDEEVVRRLVHEVLKSYGYNVLEAGHGGGAFLICERHQEPIHLLLTDVVMPEMSGRELAERLAQLRPEMKVLYMSGYTDDAIVHHGVLAANAPFIQKPFTPHALAHKVREVLGQP
jgi:PAS domain S-box-containing protein